MNEYEIWIEGWSATGGNGDATFIGKAKGRDFNEACRNVVYHDGFHYEPLRGKPLINELDKDKNGELRINSRGTYSDWACGLFDNEVDARKSFG